MKGARHKDSTVPEIRNFDDNLILRLWNSDTIQKLATWNGSQPILPSTS